ncbi:MAG: L,D-transpeptidase family protein [Planctomycetota bacterium]
MGRFILGVLLAALGFWAYGRYFGESAATGGGEPLVFAEVGGQGRSSDPASPSPSDGADRARPGENQPEQSPADEASASFATLRTAGGIERDRIATALHRALRGANSPASRIEVLGADNAFLHTAEGRDAAAAIQTELAGLEPWTAVRSSTALLERAVAGSIELADREAKAALDGLLETHGRFVRQTVCNPVDLTAARRQEVRPGEALATIARAQGKSLRLPMSAGLLQIVNRISDPNRIQAGQVLKIPTDAVEVRVFKRAYLAAIYVGDVLVRAYACAHGKPGHETPEADFEIGDTIERPDWNFEGESIPYGDPRNPLGTHFVKFLHESLSGFGAHGTNEPATIGTCASLGCIRLGEREIEEFARIVPKGTRVRVVR